jgi:hypothetical protein
MVHKANYFFILIGSVTALLGFLFFSGFPPLPHALGQEAPPPDPTPIPTAAALLDKTFFRTGELASVTVRPLFEDFSTNIAFYMQCPNPACPAEGTPDAPVYIFSAENLGHGMLPFSEYWEPPLPADYVAIEYRNDDQQFTCSDKSITECKNDARFISFFEFAVVDDTTIITSEMIASKNTHLRPALSALFASSSDLLSLSITLSSPFITSDLENGQIVTALLDGKSVPTGELTLANTTSATALQKLSVDLSAPFITSDLENGQIVTALLDGASLATSELTLSGTTTATALQQLSIDLSAPSISSSLDDGQIVTAILDNKPSVIIPATSSTVEETADSNPVSDFILDIVDAVVHIFTPDTDEPVEPTETEVVEESDAEQEPAAEESAPEPEPEPEPAPEPASYETTPSPSL